jgi:N-acetyl-alpha-D-muramate 1-phosphate uridylyltransferase
MVLPDGSQKYTFAGVSVLSPRLFASLPAGKAALAPVLRQAITQGLVSAEHHADVWVDVGTPERLADLDASIRTNTV